MSKKLNIKDLSDAEIDSQLEETYRELREQRFQLAVAKTVENPSVFKTLRRKIAALKTVQHERKLKPASE